MKEQYPYLPKDFSRNQSLAEAAPHDQLDTPPEQAIQETQDLSATYMALSYGEQSNTQPNVELDNPYNGYGATVMPGLIPPDKIPFRGIARAIKKILY